MKIKRYYVENELKPDELCQVTGEEFHHLKNVMRTNVGDEVILFNGNGYDAYGVVEKISKQAADILVKSISKNESEPSVGVTLYQAVCKGEKLSLITQKITELGASELQIFYSRFTDIKDKTNKVSKLNKVCISALKQCGRSKALKIGDIVSFEEMVKLAKEKEKVFVAYENADGINLYKSLSKNAKFKEIGVIIGAEGGFSQEEVDLMNKNGFEIVTLGKRILRAETAAIAAVAQVIFATEE